MTAPSPAIRNLARHLLASTRSAVSAAHATGSPRVHEAVALCETLRISLTKFAGADGFAALLRRALALARVEAPALQSVRLGATCQLEGLEGIAVERAGDAAVALAAHLLSLLVTFIGEPLTLRLVREGWPNAQLDA
jgi:hypothetical protein